MEMVPEELEIDPLVDTGEWKRAMLERLDTLIEITREQNEREKTLDSQGHKLGAAVKRVWRAVLAAAKDLEG